MATTTELILTVVKAANDAIAELIPKFYSHSADESGYRNPDRYDDLTKELKESIQFLKKIREECESYAQHGRSTPIFKIESLDSNEN